jgi:hypothetical protein
MQSLGVPEFASAHEVAHDGFLGALYVDLD